MGRPHSIERAERRSRQRSGSFRGSRDPAGRGPDAADAIAAGGAQRGTRGERCIRLAPPVSHSMASPSFRPPPPQDPASLAEEVDLELEKKRRILQLYELLDEVIELEQP